MNRGDKEMPTKAELEQEIKRLERLVEEKHKLGIEWQDKAKELEKENRKLRLELSRAGDTLSCLVGENKALKKLKNVHVHNERGAGRKKDSHLEVYLMSCWAKGMTDQEIIGSEYDSFDGKKKVAHASYYRAKKRLYQK